MSVFQPLPLGRFQFENLVHNRVPFLLLKSDVDVESLFGVLEKLHLRNYSSSLMEWTFHEAETVIKEKGGVKETPILVLCEDGKKSESLSKRIAEAGYLNVYFLAGGFQELQ